MFIYHFHRIIRHRLVWGIFAIITAVLFLSVDSCVQAVTKANSVAKLGGTSIMPEEFDSVERHVRGYGRNRDNETPFHIVATQVWQNIAALQTARQLGFTVSPAELQEALKDVPAFAPNGTFDRMRYREVLDKNMGVTPPVFEAYLQHQMTLHKLGALVESAAWITPVEMSDEMSAWTDQFTVRYATATNRFATAPMGVTDAQLRAYYDERRQAFALPNRVAVQYVAISVSNLIDRVSVPEEDVTAYYDDHGDTFVRLTTNNTTEAMTLAEARPQIVVILKQETARQAAFTNLCTSFLKLASDGGDAGFATAATAFGLPVRRTPLFSAQEPLPDIEDDTRFRESAFELDPAQADGRYSVVRGTNYVYAIAAYSNSPAHMPSFEACIDEIRPLALAKARAEAFKDYATSLHESLVKTLKEGKAFETAAQAKALNVSSAITFTAHSLSRESFDHSFAVVQAAIRLRPGEVSEAQPVPGGAIFVNVIARQAGDPLSAEMLRNQVRASVERSRAAALMPAWLSWNLEHKGLVPSKNMAARLAAPAKTDQED